MHITINREGWDHDQGGGICASGEPAPERLKGSIEGQYLMPALFLYVKCYRIGLHTFGSMAAGGFSSRNISVEAFHSPYVEAIIIVFMLLAGLNFSLYYRAIQRRSLAPVFKSLGTRTFLAIIGLPTIIMTINLIYAGSLPAASAFRHSIFQVVSIITTTGFTSINYDVWPPLAKGILFFLMFVGGCTGSTGGAIKVARIILLLHACLAATTQSGAAAPGAPDLNG